MSASEASALAALLDVLFQSKIATISAAALLTYDWILVFDREVDLVWRRGRSLSRLLYLLGRPGTLLGYIITIVLSSPVSDQTCHSLTILEGICTALPYVFLAVFSTLRGYALSDGNHILSAVVFLLSMVPVGLNTYVYAVSRIVNSAPPLGCAQEYPGSAASLADASYISRGSVMLAEFIVIVLTWRATGAHWDATSYTGRKSFRDVLFRNGTFSFGVALLLNTASLVLALTGEYTSQNEAQMAFQTVMPSVRDSVTSVVTLRFLLSLLEMARNAPSEGTAAVLSTEPTGSLEGYGSTAFYEDRYGDSAGYDEHVLSESQSRHSPRGTEV